MIDGMAQGIWILLAMLIVGGSLVARRAALARLVAWSACWVALFLGVYTLFTMIGPQIATWQQSHRGGEVTAVQSVTIDKGKDRIADSRAIQSNLSGAGVSIPMGRDGHYWVDALVNGQTVRFLVDSGAGITAVSQSTADSLGLASDPMNQTMVIGTANGEIIAKRSAIPAMEIGSIHASELPIVVSAAFGGTNVLGMNFLNKLDSWRVEDGHMVLEPH